MTLEMRKTLACLPYEEKLRRVAALIEFSRQFKAAKSPPSGLLPGSLHDAVREVEEDIDHGRLVSHDQVKARLVDRFVR